jgi:hypothetical protein
LRFAKTMVGHCVNENCNRPLSALAEGRLFQFEVVSISLAVRDESKAPFDEKPHRKTVHFWLCGECASSFTVVLEPARGLKLVSLEECNLSDAESQSKALDAMPAAQC